MILTWTWTIDLKLENFISLPRKKPVILNMTKKFVLTIKWPACIIFFWIIFRPIVSECSESVFMASLLKARTQLRDQTGIMRWVSLQIFWSVSKRSNAASIPLHFTVLIAILYSESESAFSTSLQIRNLLDWIHHIIHSKFYWTKSQFNNGGTNREDLWTVVYRGEYFSKITKK